VAIMSVLFFIRFGFGYLAVKIDKLRIEAALLPDDIDG
jgi:hypothetical protein